MTFKRLALPLALSFACLASAASAQLPEPTPMPTAAIPAPVDAAWPGGVIDLDIDARDLDRRIFRVTQTFPLVPGTRRLTLLYPEWLPGNHAPRGPIASIAELTFTAGGRRLEWRRDPLDVYAFHVEVPDGAREVVAHFVHTSPLAKDEGRITMTPEMLNLQWEKMTLYPAGHYVSRIAVRPSVTFPEGWTIYTALDGASANQLRVSWAQTDYETLVDSPIFAGAYARRWDLGNSVKLDVVADSPGLLVLRDDNLKELSALSHEAERVFGKPPFEKYDFLVALSDRIGGIGLEHLKSSENQLEPLNFLQWDQFDWDRNVLAHELVHAWNGKYRRPARLWTPDYRTPMQDDLLWVYEGQTQFWGWVLAARSGTQDKETVLAMIADRAGFYTDLPGRQWRSVVDTTLDPIVGARKPKPYTSLHRGEDYYNEGALLWLEADQLIRRETGGAKGLDDFARAFFAHRDDGRVRRYEFDEVVATLNAVHPHDWAAFLKQRFEGVGQPAPLAGIEAAGYRLVWRTTPNAYTKARMEHVKQLNLNHSLGLALAGDGDVTDVRWGSPAFEAGIVTGTTIVAVDGYAFSTERIQRAISRAAADRKPIELILRKGDRFSTVRLAYYDDLRWPWLEPVSPGREAGLDRLLAPRR
ncbi:MAG: peptidase M61 [Sphingomonadaceae bacterium]